MSPRKPADLDDLQLADEISDVVNELLELGELPDRIGRYDKFDMVAGAALLIADIAIGGPVTIAGVVVAAAGAGLLGAGMMRRLANQTGDRQRIARVDRLRVRHAALYRELRIRKKKAQK